MGFMSQRGLSWVSTLLTTAAALWGSGWGCGGVVTDTGKGHDGGAQVVGAGGFGPLPPPEAGGAKMKPRPPMCGNGVIDGNELCDGSSFRSDVSSCGQALMGSYYYGSLRCTSNCTIDTSGCYQQGDGGAPSFGGGPNGGVFGQGAMGGIFGFPNTPANDCYANGGVPDPASGNCLFGAAATNVCFSLPGGSSCVAKCGCSYCANLYAHCESDGACPWILSCAGQAKCSSLAVCMQAGCANIVDSAGGPKTVSASLADQVLSCFASNGCPPGC